MEVYELRVVKRPSSPEPQRSPAKPPDASAARQDSDISTGQRGTCSRRYENVFCGQGNTTRDPGQAEGGESGKHGPPPALQPGMSWTLQVALGLGVDRLGSQEMAAERPITFMGKDEFNS